MSEKMDIGVTELNKFYEILSNLEKETREFSKKLSDLWWPKQGVYFFLDKNENPINDFHRVVRVGTHGIRKPYTRLLRDRLKEHWGKENGGGEHRASIFRGYVGSCYIEDEELQDKYPEWGKGRSAERNVKEREYELEKKVSNYIRNLSILVLDIDSWEERKYIETNSIAFLSSPAVLRNEISGKWLGHKCNFRNKGLTHQLWNRQDCEKEVDDKFFEKLIKCVENTKKNWESY